MVMDAMNENRDIVVHGKVSRELLSNLVEYQAVWNKWLPEIYNRVNIKVEEIIENPSKVSGALCAFSGGVDATFTVFRNSLNKNSYRSQKINLCSIIHGFDIPLVDNKAFNNVLNQASKTLKVLGIPILPIRTNYRHISNIDNWSYAHLWATVGTLINYKGLAGVCLIGSTEPYNSLVIPWGSTPISDHLLSSASFKVMHDGASHSRNEKVKELAEWNVGLENLRVCIFGEHKDRNCGQCEKCIRTMLNFLVNKLEIPSSFPKKIITKDDLLKIKLSNNAIRAEWRQINEFAKKNNVEAEWVNELHNKLNPTYSTMAREKIKKILKPLIKKARDIKI